MGFRFRKSKNLGGGFRLNISKSGIGGSWGVKGFRFTRKCNGGYRATCSIPGTGISYTKDIKVKNNTTEENNGCQGCALLLFGILFGVIMTILTLKDSEQPRPSSSITSPTNTTKHSTSIVEYKTLNIVHPFRVWKDKNGQKVKAQLVQIAGENVTLRNENERKTFKLKNFSEKDQRFLLALQNFDDTSVSRDSHFEIRTWNPWGLPKFKARLIDASPDWIILERKGKLEIYSRSDFSALDLKYFRKIGWHDRIKSKK
ncbi:MAG: DUF4236 domain-containing protein [Thermoguttaceae bacterium]|nr:DUF4236 domain-containing protein [Thermoguttaceae bacterium]